MNTLGGGGQQQALIAALAGRSPFPPRTTSRVSVDGTGPGSSYSIPPQQTPFGAFHDPGEQANPYVNPGNVGAVAAGNPFGAENPGGPMQRTGTWDMPGNVNPNPNQNGQSFDPRAILQAILGQQRGGFVQGLLPQHNSFVPGQHARSDAPFLQGPGTPAPWDTHHGMVNASSALARFLAQQHTAGLRRYNGRH